MSAMAGELIAFNHLFDRVATIASNIFDLFGKYFLVQLLTDSKIQFDAISKGSRTYEKRECSKLPQP